MPGQTSATDAPVRSGSNNTTSLSSSIDTTLSATPTSQLAWKARLRTRSAVSHKSHERLRCTENDLSQITQDLTCPVRPRGQTRVRHRGSDIA